MKQPRVLTLMEVLSEMDNDLIEDHQRELAAQEREYYEWCAAEDRDVKRSEREFEDSLDQDWGPEQ